jgi:hypothetical protein
VLFCWRRPQTHKRLASPQLHDDRLVINGTY